MAESALSEGGPDRSNIGTMARLAITSGQTVDRIVLLADLSRRLGDLDAARELLSAQEIPNTQKFAHARALFEALHGSQPSDVAANTAIPVPFIRRTDFLSSEQLRKVKELTEERIGQFVSSEIYDGEYAGVSPETRRSLVLRQTQPLRDSFLLSLKSLIFEIDIQELRIHSLDMNKIELQITSHGDGAFFKPHVDAASHANSGRKLSFVFYYHLIPNGFSGGALRLYDSDPGNRTFCSESFTTVEPGDNSIVLFPSSCVHEVVETISNRSDPRSSRFSINGWVHGKLIN